MKNKNFERYAIRMTNEIMRTEYPVLLETTSRELWLVLSTIQYSWREPNLSQSMRDALRQLATPYEVGLLTMFPESADMIAAGWDISMDISTNRHSPDNGGQN